jgi:hypothetical protein
LDLQTILTKALKDNSVGDFHRAMEAVTIKFRQWSPVAKQPIIKTIHKSFEPPETIVHLGWGRINALSEIARSEEQLQKFN